MNSELPRIDPDGGREEDLNQGPPDFKSSELNHSAMPPRLIACIFVGLLSCLPARALALFHTVRDLKGSNVVQQTTVGKIALLVIYLFHW